MSPHISLKFLDRGGIWNLTAYYVDKFPVYGLFALLLTCILWTVNFYNHISTRVSFVFLLC